MSNHDWDKEDSAVSRRFHQIQRDIDKLHARLTRDREHTEHHITRLVFRRRYFKRGKDNV